MLGFHSVEFGTFQPVRRQGKKAQPSSKPGVKRVETYGYPGHYQIRTPSIPTPPVPFARAVKKPPQQTSYQPQQPVVDVQQLYYDHLALIDVVNRMWDALAANNPSNSNGEGSSQRIKRLEREVADLRQQQNLLAKDKQEDAADLSNIVAEMTALKQRLSRTLSQTESQLHVMEKASVPAQLQKDVAQLQTDCNWLYATVVAEELPYYATPSLVTQPAGTFLRRSRILVLYRTVENEEGLWMQTRQSSEPEKRFWVKLTDGNGDVTIGHFGVTP